MMLMMKMILITNMGCYRKHGLMNLNNIEFPLFLLEFLNLYLFCLPMLFALRFHDLSLYKTILYRKWFRFKCVSYFLFDALSCFKFLYSAFALKVVFWFVRLDSHIIWTIHVP
jgi:hypothetical protein